MLTLRTIGRLQHRRSTLVRGAMLFLLAMVTVASMPKWVTHSHDRVHDTALALTADVAANHHHDGLDDADEPDSYFPDPTHSHVHYVAGAAVTLPATFAELCQFAVLGDACPVGRAASTSLSPLTRLHRPPIV